ncbi:MAG: GNAT family N-acetyltransferase, partial [Phycisphaerales bacterium]|nr:GNAT family N-acetyltransferase [Phycisphaerales bacterium]
MSHRLTKLGSRDRSDMIALSRAGHFADRSGDPSRWLSDGAIAVGMRSFGRLVGWIVVRPDNRDAHNWRILAWSVMSGWRSVAISRRLLRFALGVGGERKARRIEIDIDAADAVGARDIESL